MFLYLRVEYVLEEQESRCWHLFTDDLVLIAAANHPWTSRGEIALAELKDAEWILREGGAATRQLVLATLAEQGLPADDLRVAMELGSVEAVEAVVEAGHGVSFVSRVAVQRGLELRRIKTIDVKELDIKRQVFLAHNKMRTWTCAQLSFASLSSRRRDNS